MSNEEREIGKWPVDDLPSSWEWARFSEVFDNVTSSEHKLKQKDYSESGELPVVDQGQELIGGYTDDAKLRHPCDLPVVLFGDHTQCVKYLDFPFVQGADGTKVLKPTECVKPRFAYLSMRTLELPKKGYSRHFKFLRESMFPVAPLAEQRRIVAKIEALQERSRKAREMLTEVGPLLEQFRQSLLAAAFRGDLTADWREQNPNTEPATELLTRIRTERRQKWEQAELAKYEAKGKLPPKGWKDKYKEPERLKNHELDDIPSLPESWCWTRVGELIESIDAGRSPTAHSRPAESGECGVLKVSAVTWREFDPTANKALKTGDSIEDTPTPRAGDVLISRANTVELIGAVVLVKADYPNLMLSDKLLRLNRVSNEILPGFLLFGLRSKSVRDSFEANATGTSNSMRNLSQAKILDAPIALAPLEEQSRIAELLVAAGETVDLMETELAESESALTNLDQSILANAFRGELVPQDPNDEPASVLLERIHEQREAEAAGSKKSKKSTRGRGKQKATSQANVSTVAKLSTAQFTKGILTLLAEWKKPVSIRLAEPALQLYHDSDLRDRILNDGGDETSKPTKQKLNANDIHKKLPTALGNLRGKQMVTAVGDDHYQIGDISAITITTAEKNEAREAIKTLRAYIEAKEIAEELVAERVAEAAGGRLHVIEPIR